MSGSRATRIFVAVALGSSMARADPDRERADRLFDDGKAAVAAADWRLGCALFAESMAADPSPSTELKLARCAERDHRLVETTRLVISARTRNQARNAARPELRDELERLCVRWLAQLDQQTPRLRIDPAPLPPGALVRLDGVPISLAEPSPADPGLHRLDVTAAGFVTSTLDVDLAEGEHRTISLRLVALAAPDPPVKAQPITSPSRSAPPFPWGAAALGVGAVASLAGATYFGFKTRADVADSNAWCNSGDDCLTSGVALRNRARGERAAAVVLGALSVGLGAAAVGVRLSDENGAAAVTVAGRW